MAIIFSGHTPKIMDHSAQNSTQNSTGKVPNKKFIVIGASHANKLFYYFSRNPKYTEHYQILNYTSPGACLESIIAKEIPKLESHDVLFFQALGNDVFERHMLVNRLNGVKTIHCTRMVERKDDHFRKLFLKLKVFLESENVKNAKRYILDIPYRHVKRCCEEHKFNAIKGVRYQRQVNLKLKYFISNQTNATYLDHRRFLPGQRQEVRKDGYYASLQCDNVHFTLSVYKHIVDRLFAFLELSKQAEPAKHTVLVTDFNPEYRKVSSTFGHLTIQFKNAPPGFI